MLFALGSAKAQSLIVRLDVTAPPALSGALAGGAGKTTAYAALFDGAEDVRPVAPTGLAGAFVIEVRTEAERDALIARWAATPGVRYAQSNHVYRLEGASAPADVPLDSLRHLVVTGTAAAHRVTTGSASVRVGFVDTGLHFAHPAFEGQVAIHAGEDLNRNGRFDAADLNGLDDDGNGYVDDVRGYDFVDRQGSDGPGEIHERDADPSDDNRPGGGRGHGTLVAGVLGAAYRGPGGALGAAPGARLVPLRAFAADGLGEDDDVAAAIVYAADLGLDVLNLSFGDVYESPIMREAIAYAVAKGVTVAASAGNSRTDRPHYPSDFPDVIAVAWLTEDGTALAGQAGYGVGIDVGAPASGVYTTAMPPPARDSPGVTDFYGRASGSSFAAPQVAGAAALLKSLDPSLSPAAVRAILTATADDVGAPGWDHETGSGLLRTDRALLRSLPARTEIASPEHDGGVAAPRVAIVGTALDPSFVLYTVDVARGDSGQAGWTLLPNASGGPVRNDTLAVWNTAGLPDGAYTLRLRVALREGRTVEDRRRVYLDRTAPRVTVVTLREGFRSGRAALLVDVETDDLTRVTLRGVAGAQSAGAQSANADSLGGESDRRARRHGLVVPLPAAGRDGLAGGALRVENASGLVTTVPFERVATTGGRRAFPDEAVLEVPGGLLLPIPTDFDGDGLREIVLNVAPEGAFSDTLAYYEWNGTSFARVAFVLANVLPRDAGDADGDGRLELLTQVQGATLLLEARTPGAFPDVAAFVDTTGLRRATDPKSLYGARLADLDGDGRGEIIGHNSKGWRVLEWNGTAFREVATLFPDTLNFGRELDRNELGEPDVLIGDFDRDGRQELVSSDADGDLFIYEATGADNAYRRTFTFNTPRYSPRPAFASGDFDGDGRVDFALLTRNYAGTRRDREQEPPFAFVTVFTATGDDAYVVTASAAFAAPDSRYVAMAAWDADGDGREELAVSLAPDLYAFALEPAPPGAGPEPKRLRAVFHRGITDPGAPSGLRSASLLTGDFDGDGRAELVAALADGKLHRFAASAVPRVAAPVWAEAYAASGRAHLRWRAPGADSVQVFAGDPGGALDRIAATTADTLAVASGDAARAYRLRAWAGGAGSPLSDERRVTPSATPVPLAYTPAPEYLWVDFSEPLAEPLAEPAPGAVTVDGAPARGVVLADGDRRLVVGFERRAPGTTVRVAWTGLRGRSGAQTAGAQTTGTQTTGVPVAAGAYAFVAAAPAAELIVLGADVLGADRVRLRFSEPLDAATASVAGNYAVRPIGRVVAAAFDPARPAEVVLTFEDVVVGATGLSTSVTASNVRGASGARLADEGRAVRLSEAAADLGGVYAFPNPYREGVHDVAGVMIAGLPAGADVRILSVDGRLVRTIEERDGDGGARWDLTDRDGARVGSGVYLVRVEAVREAGRPSEPAVLVKVALIR